MKTVGKLVFTDICDERWMFLSEIIFDGLFQNLLRRIWVLQKKALDNTIVDVLQKGFTIKGEVLRAAKVTVAQ